MYVAFKQGLEPPAERTPAPTKKEKLQKFAEALERKWRLQDRDKAIKKYQDRIKKIGLPLEIIRTQLNEKPSAGHTGLINSNNHKTKV